MKSPWDQVKELFAACADLDSAQLASRLAGEPEEIRGEVEFLLAAEKMRAISRGAHKGN